MIIAIVARNKNVIIALKIEFFLYVYVLKEHKLIQNMIFAQVND